MFTVFKRSFVILSAIVISACSSFTKFQPIETISQVDTQSGYRLMNNISHVDDDLQLVLTLSGGGTRAAAFGYGVLEEFSKVQLKNNKNVLESIDLVFGVSGGSVLASYLSLNGSDTVPSFEKKFLLRNFQRDMILQVVSLANLPKLTSDEYGRGDLLQEQFENYLFGKKTFAALDKQRKGPFAVISATDMNSGKRFDFIQETFDAMCLNLNDLEIARAVASSSAVPIIFSPLTLNNHGGNCHYQAPAYLTAKNAYFPEQQKTLQTIAEDNLQYEDSKKRPFIHLVDGGLTDNLGLRGMLELAPFRKKNTESSQFLPEKVRHIVIINVNAQNRLQSDIDKSASVPSISQVINAVINVPIDNNSALSIQQFRNLAKEWNNNKIRNQHGDIITLHFVSLNLYDLPDSDFKTEVLNIPTSFHLPKKDIDNLKKAAHLLLKQSKEYQEFLEQFQQTSVLRLKQE